MRKLLSCNPRTIFTSAAACGGACPHLGALSSLSFYSWCSMASDIFPSVTFTRMSPGHMSRPSEDSAEREKVAHRLTLFFFNGILASTGGFSLILWVSALVHEEPATFPPLTHLLAGHCSLSCGCLQQSTLRMSLCGVCVCRGECTLHEMWSQTFLSVPLRLGGGLEPHAPIQVKSDRFTSLVIWIFLSWEGPLRIRINDKVTIWSSLSNFKESCVKTQNDWMTL